MEKIMEEENTDGKYNGYGLVESMVTSFENNWDVMPAGRSKVSQIPI